MWRVCGVVVVSLRFHTAGNHYLEIQVVDEVFDEKAASAMGLKKGNVCVMIHSGSRGLGHQVCTDSVQTMEK